MNLTYLLLIRELIQESAGQIRLVIRARAIVTLAAFAGAAAMAPWLPVGGLTICIVCLAFYLKPEPKPLVPGD